MSWLRLEPLRMRAVSYTHLVIVFCPPRDRTPPVMDRPALLSTAETSRPAPADRESPPYPAEMPPIDVYKRQVRDVNEVGIQRAVHRDGAVGRGRSVAGEDDAASVSYTHLDVYKRQGRTR